MLKTTIKIILTLTILFWAGFARAETYRVKSGDTLTKIAAKYKVSINQLKA